MYSCKDDYDELCMSSSELITCSLAFDVVELVVGHTLSNIECHMLLRVSDLSWRSRLRRKNSDSDSDSGSTESVHCCEQHRVCSLFCEQHEGCSYITGHQ